MRTACAILATITLLANQAFGAEPAQVRLEKPSARQGYYYTAGLNGGMATSRVDGRASDVTGSLLAFHIGQSVLPWMDLGLAIEAAFGNGDERSGLFTGLGFEWTLHPRRALFVRLGAGLGVNRITPDDDDDPTESVFGANTTLGVGYDFYPFYRKGSGALAISPVVMFKAVQLGAEDHAYWGTLGVEFTWWSGLPSNQLDLTTKEAFGSD